MDLQILLILTKKNLTILVVGVEPTLLTEPDFESGASANSAIPANLERKTRFELATPTLARWCSTTELLPHTILWRRLPDLNR